MPMLKFVPQGYPKRLATRQAPPVSDVWQAIRRRRVEARQEMSAVRRPSRRFICCRDSAPTSWIPTKMDGAKIEAPRSKQLFVRR